MESFNRNEQIEKVLTNTDTHQPQEQEVEIVQCPKCQTKFAIDTKIIESYGTAPRFHCSRCDNLFTSPEHSQSRLPFKDLPATSSSRLNKSIDVEIVEESSSSSNKSRSLDIPRSFSNLPKRCAPHEHENEEEDAVQESFGFHPNTANHHQSSFTIGEINRQEEEDSYQFSNMESEFEQPHRQTLPYKKRSPLVITSLPLLLFLSLLAAFSIYLRVNEAAAGQLADSILPSMPQTAPANLYTKNVELKPIVLNEGQSIYVISGTIKNETDRSFAEILIEASLLSQDGNETLITKQFNAGATLAKTRIKSLSLEMIDELQSGRMARHFQLAPGEELEFAVALHGDEIDQAQFYTLRIYSVQ